MDLVGQWRSRAARAAGTTAVAPAVVLGAAALLAAGGGLGGVGALGQVAAGPSAPLTAAPVAAQRPPAQAVATLTRDPVAAPTAAGGGTACARTGSGAAPQTVTRRTGGRRDVPVRREPQDRPRTGSPTTGPSSPSTPARGTVPSTSVPAPSSGSPVQVPSAPVKPLTDTIHKLTDPLPAPVGPVTDKTLDSAPGLPR